MKYAYTCSPSVTGAAAIPVEMVLQMRKRLGFETIVTGYGLTETHGIVTANAAKLYTAKPASCGRIVPTLEGRLEDEAGNVLRSLNSKIILNPRGEGGVDAVLDGDLATILAFPDGAREKRERPGAAAPRRFRCGCGGWI